MSTTATPELLTELFTDWAQRDGILARVTDRQQVADLALAFGAGFMIAQALADEDAEDAAEADASMDEPGEDVPWEQVRAEGEQ